MLSFSPGLVFLLETLDNNPGAWAGLESVHILNTVVWEQPFFEDALRCVVDWCPGKGRGGDRLGVSALWE